MRVAAILLSLAIPLFAQEPEKKSPEPEKPAPEKTEPAPTEPAKTEPAKTEPGKAGTEKAEPAKEQDADLPKDLTGSISGKTEPKVQPRFSPGKAPAAQLPQQYLYLVAEAMKSFQARDFDGAMLYIGRADEVLPPTVWSLNVRGAIAIEKHEWEKGLKYCKDALALEPGFFPAQFNLCEIPFLQGDYATARKMWETLLSRFPPEDPTTELLIYRIYLTYLMQNDLVHAREWLDRLPFPSQTPAYQYANAAWERQNGNLEKWHDWLRSAEYIWPQVKRANFLDALIHLRWLDPKELR
jgi:hypothetical protein